MTIFYAINVELNWIGYITWP